MSLCLSYFLVLLSFSVLLFLISMYFLMLSVEVVLEFDLFNLSSVSLVGLFYLDWVSLLFMSFVLFISSMIINYSAEYMAGDVHLKRFIYLMLLFVFSMMLMITSLNLVSILLGWDGLGLVSYVLVIYYQNVKSYNAGMLTALSNRIGDAALLVGIAFMCGIGSWSFPFYLDFNVFYMKYVSLFCVLAAFTKSAQIPFSSWLPAAMAAPTPVSSLVHSSTLVTAGVYLLIRISPCLSVELIKIMLFLSLFTMFMAGVCANLEYDLKKIIALSTLSQLGMMIFILSLGGYDLAFFHLLTHALFKALLFMCAGVVIHSMGNVQDIRYMGGLVKVLPITSICMNISNFALCGIPFLAGFYSKDLIAETFSMNVYSIFTYIIFYFSIGLTVSYSLRLSYFIFFGDFNVSSLSSIECFSNKIMVKSMVCLVFFVIFMGSALSWFMLLTPYYIIMPFYMKVMTLLLIFLGAFIGLELVKMEYYYHLMTQKYKQLAFFLSGMWNLPILSTSGLSWLFLTYGKNLFKNNDYGWYEYYGASGLFKVIKICISNNHILSKNYFKAVLLIFFIYLLL
uniref:NADH-ubiquinone oxidoreductase chain 5 n=1 Tax=Scolytinae sp. BMNH 1274292 TaxID=2558040 RepID=A0A126TF76_9CUCU|nr:NADH dehydrogenase subunit 5 [Scolytinae sp. BMNH 1274292]